MRKILSVILAACSLSMAVPEMEAAAAPASPAPILEALDAGSMIQDARVFCYNRYTGRFLHWGSCYRRHVYRRYRHPRVYCYSRRTGRFLHWGHC